MTFQRGAIVEWLETLGYGKYIWWHHSRSGPSCSKLTTSLVNVSLNFKR